MDGVKVKKCVLLYSGGLDSTTLLYWLSKECGYHICALTFLYGQKHFKELEFAKRNIERIEDVEHYILDLSWMGSFLRGSSSLITGGEDVPELESIKDEDKIQPSTYVPNRNMILLSISVGIAESIGVEEVYYSAQAHDEYGYWDCTEEFVNRMNKVIELNRKSFIRVCAPFLRLRKSEIIRLGLELGVDYSLTWSCYKGGDRACGVCPTCVERLKGFSELGIRDPLDYEV